MNAPKGVRLSVLWLWISVGAGVIGAVTLMAISKNAASDSLIVSSLIVLALESFVITQIAAGKNWARILLILITALGIVIAANTEIPAAIELAWLHFLRGVSFLLSIAACILLSTKPVNAWFSGISTGKISHDSPTPETHIICPDCKEFIKKEARVCKHCGCKLIPE